MKEEALELADFLEKNMVASVAILGDVTATHIVSTIRRLVEELDKQGQPVAWMREDGVIAFHKQKEIDSQGFKWQPLYTAPQTKPLSDDEIIDIWFEIGNAKNLKWQQINFARAIEDKHGIK